MSDLLNAVRSTKLPDRLELQNVLDIMEHWFDTHHLDRFPWQRVPPERVEIAFSRPLNPGVCVCGHKEVHHATSCTWCECPNYAELQIAGKKDLVVEPKHQTGVLWPVDNKTGSNLDARWVRQYEMESQMSTYCWDTGVNNCFINGIELYLLPAIGRKCSKHKVDYADCRLEHYKRFILGPIVRTPLQIEQWKEDAAKAARDFYFTMLKVRDHKNMEGVPMQGRFNAACRDCEYRQWCTEDRPANIKVYEMTKVLWKPWEDAYPDGQIKQNVFYMDNSMGGAWYKCNTQAVMRYGLSWTHADQAGPLFAGIACHKGLEVWFKGGHRDDALQAIKDYYNQENTSA